MVAHPSTCAETNGATASACPSGSSEAPRGIVPGITAEVAAEPLVSVDPCKPARLGAADDVTTDAGEGDTEELDGYGEPITTTTTTSSSTTEDGNSMIRWSRHPIFDPDYTSECPECDGSMCDGNCIADLRDVEDEPPQDEVIDCELTSDERYVPNEWGDGSGPSHSMSHYGPRLPNTPMQIKAAQEEADRSLDTTLGSVGNGHACTDDDCPPEESHDQHATRQLANSKPDDTAPAEAKRELRWDDRQLSGGLPGGLMPLTYANK